MKRILAFFLVFILICASSLSGCTAQNDTTADYTSEWSTDPSGNKVLSSDGRTTCFADELPVSIKYNDASITVEDVSFYQNEVDYSYNLFLVITIDVSELDESQIHWLRESDLKVSTYLTYEKNEYDFSSMSTLGSLLVEDQNKLYFVQTSSFFKENRYNFSGAEVLLAVDVMQEDKYQYTSSEGKSYDMNKEEGIHYTVYAPKDISDAENIPNPLYKYVADWLFDLADSYS